MRNYWLTKYKVIKVAKLLQMFLDGLTDKHISQLEAEVLTSRFFLTRKYEEYAPHLAIQWAFRYTGRPDGEKQLVSGLVVINWDHLGF